MWGINGVSSVLGSALAMILGILIGFSYAVYLSALLYAGIALATLFFKLKASVTNKKRG